MDGYWFPGSDAPYDPEWWRPLERFAGIVAADPDLPLVLPCEFMFMGRVERDDDTPRIWEYKHIESRRYVQITDDLEPYRYISPPNLEGNGTYVPREGGVPAAVDHLELHLFRSPCDERECCDGCRALIDGRSAYVRAPDPR